MEHFWKGSEISRLTVVKLLCKRNDFSERFEISNQFGLTSGLMWTCFEKDKSNLFEVFSFLKVFYYSQKFWKYTCEGIFVHVSSALEINNNIYSDIIQWQFLWMLLRFKFTYRNDPIKCPAFFKRPPRISAQVIFSMFNKLPAFIKHPLRLSAHVKNSKI